MNTKAKAARAGRKSRYMGLAGDLGGDRNGKQDLNDEDGKRQRLILPLGQLDRTSLADNRRPPYIQFRTFDGRRRTSFCSQVGSSVELSPSPLSDLNEAKALLDELG